MNSIKDFRDLLLNPDLKRRISLVLFILAIYALLTNITVPVPNVTQLQNFLKGLFASNDLLGFANLFSGGALSNFSVIMLGLGPYINASIIIQLLTQVVPKLESLSKEGEHGRRMINNYTRLLTVPLGMLQAVATILLIKQSTGGSGGVDLIGSPSLYQWAVMVASMLAGTMFLIWLGELITEKGIGNGTSIIIMAGIVAGLPRMALSNYSLVLSDSSKIFSYILIIALSIAALLFVVYLNQGEKKIPVTYTKKQMISNQTIESVLPIRVISAGVVPIIFSLAFLSVPTLLGNAFANAKSKTVADIAAWLTANFSSQTSWYYIITYFTLVIVCTYFYTSIIFKPVEMNENLQKQGGFIPGIRPGTETINYIQKIVLRVSLIGSLGLAIVAVAPFILSHIFKLSASSQLTIGGTGLLIVVSVVIETLKQLESRNTNVSYSKF